MRVAPYLLPNGSGALSSIGWNRRGNLMRRVRNSRADKTTYRKFLRAIDFSDSDESMTPTPPPDRFRGTETHREKLLRPIPPLPRLGYDPEIPGRIFYFRPQTQNNWI